MSLSESNRTAPACCFREFTNLPQVTPEDAPVENSLFGVDRHARLNLVQLGQTGGVVDVSSGALSPKARIPVAKGYQVPFCPPDPGRSKDPDGGRGSDHGVGGANEIITGGDADMLFIARELLREPYWALKAQAELGEEPTWPTQYDYAVKRRAK